MVQKYSKQRIMLESSIWCFIQELGFEKFSKIFKSEIENRELLNEYLDTEFKIHFSYNDIPLIEMDYVMYSIIMKKEPIRSKFMEELNLFMKDRFNMEPEDLQFLTAFEHPTDEDNVKMLDFCTRIMNDIKKEDMDLFTSCSFIYMYQNLKFVDTGCENCIKESVSYSLEVEDIEASKLYEKYKNKRIGEIASYLGVSTNKIAYLFFNIIEQLNYTGFNENHEKGYKDTIFQNTETNFEIPQFSFDPADLMPPQVLSPTSLMLEEFPNLNISNLDRALGSIAYLIRANTNNHITIVEETFYPAFQKGLDLALMLNLKDYIDYDGREFSISMIVRQTEIKDMNFFLTQILQLTFMELSTNLYRHYLRSAIISEVNPDNLDDLYEELDEKEMEIEDLEDDLEELENKYNELEKENELLKKEFNKKHTKVKNESIRLQAEPYIKEIEELKRKLAKMEKKCDELTENQAELKELRRMAMTRTDEDEYEENEEKFDLNKVDLTPIKNKHYIFIGGRYGIVRKLLELFPKSKNYFEMPSYGIDITKTDMIIIFPKYVNHPLYWSAIKLAKDNNIDFMFSQYSNFEQIVGDIYAKEIELKN